MTPPLQTWTSKIIIAHYRPGGEAGEIPATPGVTPLRGVGSFCRTGYTRRGISGDDGEGAGRSRGSEQRCEKRQGDKSRGGPGRDDPAEAAGAYPDKHTEARPRGGRGR